MGAFDDSADELMPRNYQTQLMDIAIKQNTIIYLPTGSGKTFIAVLVIKHMSAALERPYSRGGKITVVLVNTVALVDQHLKTLRLRTHFHIGAFTGEMNVDLWKKEEWLAEFDKYQILIMTTQILVNLCNSSYIDLNQVNLIIFDECHHGVKDQPMRSIMKSFGNLTEQPRVLGLTATLLNGNCKPQHVRSEIEHLEVTYHAKIGTVHSADDVRDFSTNPYERICVFTPPQCNDLVSEAQQQLELLTDLLSKVVLTKKELDTKEDPSLVPLEPEDGLKQLINMLRDASFHMKIFGAFGGLKATIAYMIQLERMKKHSQELMLGDILNFVVTSFGVIKHRLSKEIQSYDEQEQIFKSSSPQFLTLVDILREYKNNSSTHELCGIIFVDRRFTAKVLYHILLTLIELPEFDFIKPQFVVGYNNNPYNDSRESMYVAKQNRKIITAFCNKEVNLLIATNVLEEGIDVPDCTLIVKFDQPSNYRSYVQSKGRARAQDKEGYYYMMVQCDKIDAFQKSYMEYQAVQKILNEYLIGQNDSRLHPSTSAITKMYHESPLPAYEVAGPGSARVDMLSAVSLLSQYCQSLPGDKYTQYAPDWYIKTVTDGNLQVVIQLPVKCPIREKIKGHPMPDRKSAKRAAALEACIRLHKSGELRDDLKSKSRSLPDEDMAFLFESWPKEKEAAAGNKSCLRNHTRQIPNVLKGTITHTKRMYIHLIKLEPQFSANSDFNLENMLEMFTSKLCYAFATVNPLPELCSFPIYVRGGEITVTIEVNKRATQATEEQIRQLREFHTTIFAKVLGILKHWLVFNNEEDAATVLLLPVDKTTCEIDYDTVVNRKGVSTVEELTNDQKVQLVVDDDTFFKKIVTPNYRSMHTHYLVTRVCYALTADSPFPQRNYQSFASYYEEKYGRSIKNSQHPLLLVKGLSKKLNWLKPRGQSGRRRKDNLYDEMEEHLIPELCVKHDFPASLWIQASLLPSIVHRVAVLLQADELRCTIIRDSGLGNELLPSGEKWLPLVLDPHLSKHLPKRETTSRYEDDAASNDHLPTPTTATEVVPNLNKDFAVKILEAQFPWKDEDEPKDIDRCANVSVLDVEHYEMFISESVTREDRLLKNTLPMLVECCAAITYDETFEPKSIELLEPKGNALGPQLRDMYKVLSTAKCNEIVNLERMETLGDSFLKICSTLYIILRFPEFDEGQCTTLKCKIVSNKNLFYLGRGKGIGGYVNEADLSPESQWVMPCFAVPKPLSTRIANEELPVQAIIEFTFDEEEQVSGVLKRETLQSILDREAEAEDAGEHSNLCTFLNVKYIGDKLVADGVEAALGAFFEAYGFEGGVRFVEWMNIIPKSENMLKLINDTPLNPVLNERAKADDISYHLPNCRVIEDKLGYRFKNNAYLLQALTHSSYSPNRITDSYERLEFLGDAILDFLITCYIYEHCGSLDPGEITDLRSALVNNCTFASFTVKCGFHKFLLSINPLLTEYIDRFAEFQENRKYVIDEQVLILLQEGDMNLAEHVDVPKVLGDIFEALAGAVYLDCGKNLKIVWEVFYKIMWREIKAFSKNVPKNTVRQLYEREGVHPHFYPPVELPNNAKMMVKLEFMLNGARKFVHGFGDNKNLAKKAAAKIALRLLLVNM